MSNSENTNNFKYDFADITGSSGVQVRTPLERYNYNQRSVQNAVLQGLKDGSLSCLPNENGYADTTPCKNAVSGRQYAGITDLYLSLTAKQKGFSSNEWLDQGQMQKAADVTGERIFYTKGEMPTFISLMEKEKDQYGNFVKTLDKNGNETDKYIPKTLVLYNKSQISNPQALEKYAAQIQAERQKSNQEWLEKNGKKAWVWSQKEVVCTSSQPETYLGQFLFAKATGARFKASPEQAADFAAQTTAYIDTRVELKDKTTGATIIDSETGKHKTFRDSTTHLRLSGNATKYAASLENSVRTQLKAGLKEIRLPPITETQQQRNTPKKEQSRALQEDNCPMSR